MSDNHKIDDNTWKASWTESHWRTCRARKSLFATPQQVFDYTTTTTTTTATSSATSLVDTTAQEDDNDNCGVCFWSMPERKQVIEWTYKSRHAGNDNAESSSDRKQESQLIQTVLSDLDKANAITAENATPSATATTSHSGGLLSSLTQTILSPFSKLLSPSKTTTHGVDDTKPEHYIGDPSSNAEHDDAWNFNDNYHYEPEEEDDAFRSPDYYAAYDEANNTARLIPWGFTVLNTNLTIACLQLLEQALAMHQEQHELESSSFFPQVISRHPMTVNTHTHNENEKENNSEIIKAGAESWKDWIQSTMVATQTPTSSSATLDNNNTAAARELLSHLSDAEADFLLECLAQRGHVSIIRAATAESDSGVPKQDLVVLAATPLGDTATAEREHFHQMLASLWEITRAQTNLEAKRDEWTQSSHMWAQRALQEKQQQRQPRAGLASFKLHKLFEQRLEQCEGTLLNLEQYRHTLEEAWHTRQVVQALQSSTQTMQQLRLSGHELEQVDAIMEDHREEMERLNSIQHMVSSSYGTGISSSTSTGIANIGGQYYDEDDLMKELGALTLDDDDNVDDVVMPSPTGGGSNQNDGSSGASFPKTKQEGALEPDATIVTETEGVTTCSDNTTTTTKIINTPTQEKRTPLNPVPINN